MAESWRITHAWKKPAIPLSQPADNILRLQLDPPEDIAPHGLRLAIALDCSRSMVQEMRLPEAKQAIEQLAGQLGEREHLHLAAFSSKLTELIRGLPGGERLRREVRARLAPLEPRGLTRTQLALDWLASQLALDDLRTCVAILVTDGVPTDEQGYPVADTSLLEDRVRRMRDEGSRLYTVGIGESDYFDPVLLDRLAQTGGGRFIYQPHPGGLAAELRRLVTDCRGLATKTTELRVEPRIRNLQLSAASRISQEFQRIDLSDRDGVQVGSLGVLNEDQPTELLLNLHFPASPFGTKEGERSALLVQLAQEDAVVASSEVEITLSNSFNATQQTDPAVSKDASRQRLNELLRNLQQSDESRQTSRLLEQIIDTAAESERPEIAAEAREQLGDLKKTGKLSRHRATSLLSRTARDERHAK